MSDRIIYNMNKHLGKPECLAETSQIKKIRDTIEQVCLDANPARIYVPDPRPARSVDLGWCRRTWDKFTEWERTARITSARPTGGRA